MQPRNVVVPWTLTTVLGLALGCAHSAASGPPQPPEGSTPAGPTFADVPDAMDAPTGTPAHALSSRVTAVTVYSDRAQITRSATTSVSTESKVFAFEGLPGWVDDASVRVSASAGRIVDVRVDRSFLAKSEDPSHRKAEAHHKQLSYRMVALQDELAVLDAQARQIESIKAFSLEKISEDTIIGDVRVENYGDMMTFISDALRSTAKARRAVQRRIDELTPAYEASERTLADMASLEQLEQTTVLVTLQSSRPVDSTLELTYMMPGATWEPMHELRASTSDPETVEVLSFAVVTQTSGEDWSDAELSFSTQSSTEALRIPELDVLVLGDTHTTTRILEAEQSSFTRAQRAFEGQNLLWNKVHHTRSSTTDRFEEIYQSNLESLQIVQSKTVQIFDSLEDRGTTAHFRALVPNTVRGDGHPVRMRIGGTTLKSHHEIVAVPEQSLNAARSLQMVNTSGQSLLPGKVSLYQDGAFLGVTELDFIADGETFSVYLSVADHIKLSRRLDRKQSTLSRGKRNKMQLRFIVTIENLSSETTTFTLTDRIPVSENKDITVDRVKVTDAIKPDPRGLLHWNVTLGPKQQREFQVSYQVEYPAQLVLDAQRRRETEPSPSPASRPRRKARAIDEQLLDLESQL
ncbi:mucoidy inhibitor MuiA family protein [Paraliomyxa miuraensis]|uniref:mucoidy inhibitor MuiA family protein n=1 Tax=Paraliomyxa miuraensis TaxID=376150 RepID=UPI002251A809|nr:mucoidy inhibitor MuiA family protein [Paraliomyxa miuraensis]MCX4241978.1 mucoidy inhibitor MuiA family protein [Paraliomyxa miuraensis]